MKMKNLFHSNDFALHDLIQRLDASRRKCPVLNPLSPNGDQQQFSSNIVHTLSRDKVVRK